MILSLPKEPRLRLYDIDTNDHKEFNGVEITGEPINIGVRNPKAEVDKYIIKQGYTYLWEKYKLYDGSDFYSLWLLYPKKHRPSEIEIEVYNHEDIIDAVQYKEDIIRQRANEIKAELDSTKGNRLFYNKEIDLDLLSYYLIDNASECFKYQDREQLVSVLKTYFKS